MKRILTVLLSAVMVLALFAGCGGTKEPEPSPGSEVKLGEEPVDVYKRQQRL